MDHNSFMKCRAPGGQAIGQEIGVSTFASRCFIDRNHRNNTACPVAREPETPGGEPEEASVNQR